MLNLFNILLFIAVGINHNTDSIITKYLSEKLSSYNRFSYELVSPKTIDFSKVKIDESRKFKLNRDYGYLPVKIKTPRGKTNNSVLTVRLKLFKNVLVANRTISKSEYLSKSDFKVLEKEVSKLRDDPYTNLNNITGLRAKTVISSEVVLQNNMIEQIPDILPGDRVDAIYSKGIVIVSFPAVSRSRGVVGDIIKIKRDDNRIFKARILNNNKVKIVE